MSESKIQLKVPGIEAVEAAKQIEVMAEKFQKAGTWGAPSHPEPPPAPAPRIIEDRRFRFSLDIEKTAVILIAIFVAVIAVNHFRLVNARIEAARPCADQRR